MSEDFQQVIVIDNGSDEIKAGFAQDEEPKLVFSSVVGRHPFHPQRDIVGNSAYILYPSVNLSFPIQNGIIVDNEGMETIWHDIFYNQLKIDPAEHPVVLTEAIQNPKYNREKMAQIMFETFGVPSIYVGDQPVLSFYSSGHTTGFVAEIGDSVSQFLPIDEGKVIQYATKKQYYAGHHLTNWLKEMMHCDTKDIRHYRLYKDIKQHCCYVAFDYKDELEKSRTSNDCVFHYSHEEIISLNAERFRCPEALFDPSMDPYGNRHEFEGIHQAIFNSIKKCSNDVQKELYNTILLTGGSTKFEGLQERLEKEISLLVPPKTNIKVRKEQPFSAWRGGAIVGSLPFFNTLAIGRQEYNDVGPQIVHKDNTITRK